MSLIIYISVLVQLLLPSDFQFVKSVNVAGERHFSDPMGNVYIIKDNHLIKFVQDYTRAAEYTNLFLGNIHSIDVSDPLRILLYYRDHNQVVWVDNFLSEIRSPIWLDDLGVDQAQLVCSSNQGGFWIFNSLNNQLQYFDVNLQLVHESMTLNSLTGPDIQPTFMLEKSRKVYLNVPGFGILVFDLFGNYSKTIPLEIPGEFQATDQNLYYFKEGELYSFDLQTNIPVKLPLPEEDGFIKVEMQPDFLYLFRHQGYSVYRIRH
ncbi:MAG: hypothetical protein AMS23_07935 [Bacteroides sp. SM1_62]|nr:MAG: hypothetical protein AMS26_14335 [Bacteroides sp. SM23_62]KPL22420.1 MAG: hypothetical protein AMS23_07935 [Bacteroides sp. SM1_62]